MYVKFKIQKNMRKLFLLCLIMLISVTTMAEGYSGKIISGNKLQGLADATIQLFNNNVFVGGCKSKTDGSFSVNTSQKEIGRASCRERV